ncbi:orotidine-5'-phosphate decarboxylase [Microbacterium rhizosphaerae]|uniref:Orotidine-5'-phosphate decarboxylase n=1 Tax=Microbacterium rhizosphaerae TaxID=1678237 RepID=A0ABZ0SJ17_9MICO|nr:orotidine-5'-phosphate decarboxylase [Microbacterium rhizosphaerae]WPR88054.1 orotidine-5'-phosphate decarboxylase [Microbacterium rhizosphaerae]
MIDFGARLAGVLAAHGPLCVGIDPHEALLEEWGLDASADGVREFGLRVVEAADGRVGIVKPQVSFFERHGSAGYAALEDVLAAARAAGLLVIADAKRGDIGSTMDAYARAWLTPGSSLEADALTVSPYLGVGALAGSFDVAAEHGKGLFVLAATSNPEGASLQAAGAGDRSVAAQVAGEVGARNGGAHPGSFGLVVGATLDRAAFGLTDELLEGTPILAPGFGFQGARAEDLSSLFGAVAGSVVASESRSILSAGPGGLAARIAERAALYA